MADSATWQRNGVDISSSPSPPYQFQQNMDGVTNGLLTITSGNVDDYIGSFSCTVSNDGITSLPQSLRITGTYVSI
jgi:hypothetical protein